jgi:hypothetical protein
VQFDCRVEWHILLAVVIAHTAKPFRTAFRASIVWRFVLS